MFKKIKEFIEAFKNAYNTINVNKIDAKKAIDDYSKEVDGIVYAADSLKIIFVRLEAIYKYFPINITLLSKSSWRNIHLRLGIK